MIEHELSINKLPMIVDQPIDSIRGAAFFVGRECQDDVTIRHISFLLEPDQRGHHDGIAIFHVLRTAAVVVTIFLHKLKRISSPIFAPCFDHVEVADEQDRFVLAAAMEAHHQVFLAVVRSENVKIALRKAGVPETLRHRLRSRGHVAHRVRGVDFDQLFEDVMGKLPSGIVKLCR